MGAINGKGSILRSTDGGRNFSVVGNLGQLVRDLIISPDFSSDKTLYAGGTGVVYKTVDGGYTWQPTSNGISVKGGVIKLAISPNYQVDKTVFAGNEQGLFKTKDRGKSWVKLAGNSYGGDGKIEAIAISPNYQRDQTVIVTVRGRGLFKTVNGGKTFTRIGDELINNNHLFSNMDGFLPETVPIKFSPSYSIDKIIYGVSGTEMFKSTDGGNTWETLTIPTHNFMYLLYLRWTASPKRKFMVALIAALFSYLSLGYLGLEKKISLRKWQIRSGGAFAAFIVVLILLSA